MNASRLHVLIVDSSPEDRLIVRELLARAAPGVYTLAEAGRDDSTLGACQAARPDCVLLGYRPPDRAGLALLMALRAQGDTPVVLLTGAGDEALIVEALHLGAQDYLAKAALTPERLHLTLQRAVAMARLTRERDQTLLLLNAALGAAPAGVILLDQELRVLRVHAALAAFPGRLVAAPLGQPLSALWPELAAPCAQALAGGQTGGACEIEIAIPDSGGAPRLWHVSLQPLALPDTGAPGLCLVVREVSARPEIGQAFQASEQWLRLALAAAEINAWDWDLTAGTVSFIAPERRPFSLLSSRQIRPFAEIQATVYPPDRLAYEQAVREAIRHDAPYQIQVRVYTPEGRLRWIEVHGQAQHDAAGQPVRVVGVTRDITALKQREALQALHMAISQNLSPAHDVAATLEALALLALPGLADSCVIYLVDEDGLVRPAAGAQGSPARPLPQPSSPPLPLDQLHGPLGDVLRTGVPRLLAEVPPGLIPAPGPPAPHAALLVPLVAQGRTLGVMQLALTGAERRYADEDLALAEILAQRGAAALAYARLQALARDAQATAAAAHARLEALIASAPNGIAYLDHELRYVLINPVLAELNGLPPEQHMGRTVAEVLLDHGRKLEPILRQVLDTGEGQRDVELQDVPYPQTGLAHDWLISYFPVPGPAGEVAGVGVTVTDITQSKRTAAALRVSEERFRLLAEHAQDVIYRYKLTWPLTLEYLSPAVERMTGYPREAFYEDQELAYRLIHPDNLRAFPNQLPDISMIAPMIILRWQHKNGSTGWAEVHSWLVTDESGQPLALEGIARDITARRQAEAAIQAHTEALSRANADLSRALRLKDEFLAMMSHELRTPLTAVLGLSEALDTGLYGPLNERQRSALATLAQSGRHLLVILSDILDLVYLEAGGVSLDHQLVDVRGLCSSALQLVQGAAQQRGVHLLHSLEHSIAGMHADERRLTQILANLLDNAVRFTPPGGTVGLEVSADRERACVRFVVWDTGIGIAPEDYDRLFKPFTQVDGRLARQYGGVGLGLTLVRRLVDLHCGSISLESTPGVGSRFTISLPWRAEASRSAPTAPAPEARPPASRVVLADAHERSLTCYKELLLAQGIQVTVARTGDEAVAQVRAARPDVVVLDLQLPGLDGLSVIRQIRGEPLTATVPIIALTALALPGDREHCLSAGANRHLTRPVSPRILLETFATLVG